MDTTQGTGDDASSSASTSVSTDYARRLDEIVGQSLEIAAAAGAGLFVFFALLHPFFFDPPASQALVVLALATAVVSGILWWLARERRISPRLTQPAILVGLGVVLLHTFGLATVRPTPEITAWFGLVILGGGVLLISWHWFVALATASVGTWALVVVRAPADPGWLLEAVFVLVTSVVIGAVTLGIRRRVYRNLLEREEKLRRVNEQLDTSRRRAERAEKLQARFVANVSHDVRTPVNAIIGEVQHLEAELGDEHEERLDAIESSARHLVRLIDDILDISKAEAGQLSVHSEAFEVERLLRQCLDMVAGRADPASLELRLEVGDDVPPIVRADPDRLRQVLGNLLTNAVKFTPEGEVRLAVETEAEDPLVLRFEVEDTGIGIPEDRQEELFRPFSRVEEQPETEGTGLGLAICKRLVELQGGEIGVESRRGEGSKFWFTLPAEPADAEELEADDERRPRLAGRTAWLVGSEGIPAARLTQWGIELETMPGIGFVEEALDEGRRPDFLVLDLLTIQAPESFLAERVRAWRSQGIPVLVARPSGRELEELADLPGPGAVLPASTPEDELRASIVESLEAAGDGAESRPVLDPEMAEEHPLEILLVEDSPVVRRLLRSTLEKLGYEPDDVPSGEEALERLEEERYDLVFLDMGLPGIDGLELAKRIRASLEDPPRMVALTGLIEQETMQAAEAAGISAYLSKPADLEDIVAEIDRTPGRRSDASATGGGKRGPGFSDEDESSP